MSFEGKISNYTPDAQMSEKLQRPEESGGRIWSEEESFAAGQLAEEEALRTEHEMASDGQSPLGNTEKEITEPINLSVELREFADDMQKLEEAGLEIPAEIEERVQALVREKIQTLSEKPMES